MNDPELLEKTFSTYLSSSLDNGAAKEMCGVLDYSGLKDECKALEAYLEARTISSPNAGELHWGQRKCFSGPYPPPNPELNDIWFDVVELTPMLLIPKRDDPSIGRACWIAMHPVYQWQFNGFLKCVEVGRKLIEFPSAPDYLSTERFKKRDTTKIVTNIYHDEALAYVHWFGKFLTGHFELMNANHFLNENEFSQVLPPGMLLWDEGEFPASEFVRSAFGRDTIHKELKARYDEFLLRETGENESLPNRTVFEEWERREDIGFSTCVLLELGLIEDMPSDSIFFEFQNAAPRSESG
jgi:hypothetical protein